jgi:S-layer protein
MAYSLVQLQAYFKNANAGVDPTAAQNQGLLAIVNANAAGGSDAVALQQTLDLASDTTTAVSVQTYQFFLGFAPSAEGLAALNKAYTGSGAQANLNGENRYIAQSVSLALQNSTAKAAFSAAYGSLSQADAATQAYNVIVGSAAATAAGINIANAVAFLTSASSIAYYTAFVKANVPGIADADVPLAVKAAIVGEIIYQATIFGGTPSGGPGVGSYSTVTTNLIKDLSDDGILTYNNVAGVDLFGSYGVKQTPQTFVLTDKADAVTGGSGDDIFIGTNTTVSAADTLQGGSGIDALQYSSSGAGAVVQAGFKSAGIEVFAITSDSVGGTTFDVSGSTDVNSLINDNSSSDLTLTGLNAVTAITVRNTSTPVAGGTGTTNTTINYTAAAVAGATTTQAVALENVFNPTTGVTGAATSSVTANGVETFNVTGAGASASHLAALVSNTLTTVNIDGAQGVTIDTLTFATNGAGTLTGTVNASKNTGGINVTIANSGAADTTVTGGTGNDRADFSNGFDAKDSFDGGNGTDTLVLNNATAIGAVAGKVTSVEVLEVSQGGTGTIDLSKFAGVNSVVYTSSFVGSTGASLLGTTTITKATSTSTVTLDVGAAGQNFNIATGTGTDTAADSTTININKVATGDNTGTITVTDIESVTLNVADDTTVAGTGTLGITGLNAAKATKVTVSSNADVTFGSASGGAALTTFDGSASTGKLSLTTGLTTALTGATVKLGAGDDSITINATAGAATGGDTITLGAGKDTVIYTALVQSGDKTTDTITDFKQGEDKLDLTNLAGIGVPNGLLASTQFVGTRASFGLAQGALTTATTDGLQAVFQADTSTLWVDLDSNGQLDSNDFRIVLSGVTSLTAADIGLGLSGNSITLSAPAAVVDLTTKTNASAVATNEGDTITSSIANLAGSNVDGLLGGDTLVISDAGVVAVPAAAAATGFQNIETLVLANGTNTVSLGAFSDFKSITGGTGADTVSATNLVAGGTVDLGTGDDVLNGVTKAIAEGTGSAFKGGTGGVDIFNYVTAGGETVDLSKVSGFETLNLGAVIAGGLTVSKFAASDVKTLAVDTTAGNASVTLTAAQLDALTTVTDASGANTFSLISSDTGAVTVNLSDTTFTTVANVDIIDFSASAANKVTVTTNVNLPSLVAGTNTADTVNVTADLGVTTLNTTGFEVINATTTQAGLTAAAGVTKITASAGGTFTANAGGVTFETSGTAAYVLNGAGGNDVVTHSGTGSVTFTGAAGTNSLTSSSTGIVIAVAGAGTDTITLSTGASNDVYRLNNGGASFTTFTTGNADTITNFASANDKIGLDSDFTGGVVGSPVVQAAVAAGAVVAATPTDIVSLGFEMGGVTNVLAGVNDGSAVLANLGGTFTVGTIGDNGYIVAYDAGNAYLYTYASGADLNVTANEIVLVGTINNVAIGSLGVSNFTLTV